MQKKIHTMCAAGYPVIIIQWICINVVGMKLNTLQHTAHI